MLAHKVDALVQWCSQLGRAHDPATWPHSGLWMAATAALAAVVVVIYLAQLWRPSSPTFLDASIWQALPLEAKESVSHNTRRFRFALPSKRHRLGLPTGRHITFLLRDEVIGKDVYRPYTPVTDDTYPGYVEFVIKVYPAGKMSQLLDQLKPGQAVQVKGPRGRFSYTRNVQKAIGMLAGGTGITPMYQVAVSILRDKGDRTRVSLIFANVTEEDILIKPELDALAGSHPDRFSVFYVLDQPSPGWLGGAGHISTDMIQAHLPPPAADVHVLTCGPPLMVEAMRRNLSALRYSEDTVFAF